MSKTKFCETTAAAIIGVTLAMLVSWLGGWWALTIVGATLLVASAFFSLEAGLLVLIPLVTLFQREDLFEVSIPLAGGGLKPTDLLLFAIIAGWLFRSAKVGRSASSPFPRLPVFLVLAFVAWASFSALIGISNGTYYRLSLNELRPLLHYLLILPMLTELNAKQVRRVAAVFLAVSSVLSIRALLLYAQGAGELATYTSGGIRITSVEYLYLLFGFLLAFGLCIARRSKAMLLIPVALLNLGGLVVTFQRAGWLALAASFLFGVFFLKGYRKRFVTVTATAGFLFLALVPLSNLDHQAKSGIVSALVTRAASVGEFQEDLSAQHRLNEWEAAWTMIGEHPFIGSGLGALVTFSSPMYDESRKKLTYLSRDFYMHNSYLWIATKMGALGFGLFLLMLASAVYPAVKEARQSGKDKSALVVGVLLCFVALMVASIFGPCFNSDTITPFASFLLALMILPYEAQRDQETQ